MKSIWNKIKNFKGLKDLTSIGIANISGAVISAVFWFYLATLLGEESYGEISYFIAIAGIASVFSLVGASSTITVYSAKNVNLLPAVAIISISSSLVAAIALLVLFKNPAISIYAIGYVIFSLGLADLLGRKLYKKYAKIFILQKILLVVLSVLLYHIMGPNGVLLGFALSFFVFFHRIYQGFRKYPLDFSLL